MATNDLLQRLDFAANTTGSSASASDRVVYEDFIAGGAIAVGAEVMLDLTQGTDSDVGLVVVEATATTGHSIGTYVGGAAAAANDRVKVCLRGVCEALVEGVNSAGTNTAISAGDYLSMSDNAGVLGAFTAGTDPVPLAVAVDAVSSGAATALSTVFKLRSF